MDVGNFTTNNIIRDSYTKVVHTSFSANHKHHLVRYQTDKLSVTMLVLDTPD